MDDKDEDRLDHVDHLPSQWDDDDYLEDPVFAPRQRHSLQNAFNLELMEDVSYKNKHLVIPDDIIRE